MSKTNRYAIHSTIKEASRARLRDLRDDIIAAQNKRRLTDEAKARDAMWQEYMTTCKPLRQGKLFR